MHNVVVPDSWVVLSRLYPTETDCQVPMNERKKPTEKQQKVLDFIRFFVLHRGLAPSRPEIATAVGLEHVSNVGWFLQALENKGWLTVLPDTPRGIILNQSERVPVLEVRGAIPDDEPLLVPQRIAEYMPELIARCLAPTATFCLLINESSEMDSDGFRKGDLVAVQAVQPSEIPRAGKKVVVRVDREVLCRWLRSQDEVTIELSTLGPDGTPAKTVRLNRAKHAIRFEGVVVREFGALDLDDIEAGNDPVPK